MWFEVPMHHSLLECATDEQSTEKRRVKGAKVDERVRMQRLRVNSLKDVVMQTANAPCEVVPKVESFTMF